MCVSANLWSAPQILFSWNTSAVVLIKAPFRKSLFIKLCDWFLFFFANSHTSYFHSIHLKGSCWCRIYVCLSEGDYYRKTYTLHVNVNSYLVISRNVLYLLIYLPKKRAEWKKVQFDESFSHFYSNNFHPTLRSSVTMALWKVLHSVGRCAARVCVSTYVIMKHHFPANLLHLKKW